MTMMKRHRPLLQWPAAGLAARPLLVVVLLMALSGLTGASAQTAGLAVHHPWIRVIMPSRPAAAYFTLTNGGATPRILTGAHSPACGKMMLHRSVTKNGQEMMATVTSIILPAHGRFVFAPGGYHVMCMAPKKDLKPGRSVPVTLQFSDGAKLTAQFAVRGAMGK